MRARCATIMLLSAALLAGMAASAGAQSARAGTDVTAGQHPYASTRTGIAALMPEWALAGGKEAYRKRLADPALADSMVAGLVTNIAARWGSDLDRVQFTGVSWDTQMSAKTLTQLAECRNLEPVPENGARVLLDAVLSDSGAAVYQVPDEPEVLTLEASSAGVSGPLLLHPLEAPPLPRRSDVVLLRQE